MDCEHGVSRVGVGGGVFGDWEVWDGFDGWGSCDYVQ